MGFPKFQKDQDKSQKNFFMRMGKQKHKAKPQVSSSEKQSPKDLANEVQDIFELVDNKYEKIKINDDRIDLTLDGILDILLQVKDFDDKNDKLIENAEMLEQLILENNEKLDTNDVVVKIQELKHYIEDSTLTGKYFTDLNVNYSHDHNEISEYFRRMGKQKHKAKPRESETSKSVINFLESLTQTIFDRDDLLHAKYRRILKSIFHIETVRRNLQNDSLSGDLSGLDSSGDEPFEITSLIEQCDMKLKTANEAEQNSEDNYEFKEIAADCDTLRDISQIVDIEDEIDFQVAMEGNKFESLLDNFKPSDFDSHNSVHGTQNEQEFSMRMGKQKHKAKPQLLAVENESSNGQDFVGELSKVFALFNDKYGEIKENDYKIDQILDEIMELLSPKSSKLDKNENLIKNTENMEVLLKENAENLNENDEIFAEIKNLELSYEKNDNSAPNNFQDNEIKLDKSFFERREILDRMGKQKHKVRPQQLKALTSRIDILKALKKTILDRDEFLHKKYSRMEELVHHVKIIRRNLQNNSSESHFPLQIEDVSCEAQIKNLSEVNALLEREKRTWAMNACNENPDNLDLNHQILTLNTELARKEQIIDGMEMKLREKYFSNAEENYELKSELADCDTLLEIDEIDKVTEDTLEDLEERGQEMVICNYLIISNGFINHLSEFLPKHS